MRLNIRLLKIILIVFEINSYSTKFPAYILLIQISAYSNLIYIILVIPLLYTFLSYCLAIRRLTENRAMTLINYIQ